MATPRDRATAWGALAALALVFVLFVGAGWLATRVTGNLLGAFWINQLLGLGLPCLAALLLLRPSLRDLGLSRPPLPPLLWTLALTASLWVPLCGLEVLRSRWIADPERQALFEELLRGNFVGATLSLAALPALTEELAFRGLLLPIFARAWGGRAAILATAVLFAAFHASPEQVAVQLVLGLVFGWLRLRTGSLWPCVLAHALHNGISAVAMRDWPGLLEKAPPLSWVLGGLVLSALSAVALARGRYTGPDDARA